MIVGFDGIVVCVLSRAAPSSSAPSLLDRRACGSVNVTAFELNPDAVSSAGSSFRREMVLAPEECLVSGASSSEFCLMCLYCFRLRARRAWLNLPSQ